LDERARRVVSNETLFREVNERVKELEERFGADEPTMQFVCECGDAACADRISLTPDEYESVRADPTHFAVASGHELPDLETLVVVTDRYAVIAKPAGAIAQLAAERDPRGGGAE
jgi:hypothetical protein